MASFICDLVKPYVEKLINGAIAEARHVFCFTCIVMEFEEERARLEPERKTVLQRVKVAKERDKDIQANVGSWAEEIDKLNQVDTKSKQTCFFGFCPDCIWRYKKGKELANNLEKIKRLIEKGEKLENIELPRCLPDAERYSSKDYISFESRKSKYKELLDALKDDNNYITGLQGMGGTGKTTLAKEVGKELKQSKQFAYVVDTTVSFTPDIKKIQDDIAGSLGLKWEDCNESNRPKKLWSRLTNGEKIVVVLDDVWDRAPPLDFDEIGIPKHDNHKGCRVLVTSRSKETFNKMDCDKIIELDLLSEEEAWIMFKRYAGIDNSSSKRLIDKGRKIAKECKQLPVAISVIASSLKGQQNREHEWDVTLKSLKQPVSMHGVDDDMVGIYKCLKFSYDYLKDEKVKGLFLLCSVFREDEEYDVEVLTRLCIGVGLFGDDYGNYDDARNQVVVAKNKLVDTCLLLEVVARRLKMHDLVRDAVQWIANKEIQCVKLFDKKQKSLVEKQTNIKYLLCEGKCMDLFSFNFDGSKLETLIVMLDRDDDRECIEVPNSFFKNVNKLRVLYFSSYYHRSLSLPPTIQLLTNIRSISVENVDLGDIAILGNLQSLETLDLEECVIQELPDQITKLSKFKLLKLSGCDISMNNPFEVIKRCSSLEELYFENSFNDFCQEITLPELQRYHIRNDEDVLYLDIAKFPKYVVFYGDKGDFRNISYQLAEETFKYCMQTAEALFLVGIKGEWRNLSRGSGMNDLVELHLGGISQLRCLIDTIGSQVPNVLSKLVVLELEEMENLEELFNGPLSFESLNNLENLSIKDCKHLRSLFKGKLNLCNLKTITLENCPMLVSLFEVPTSQSLVLLETLTIVDCEGLETIIADERREDEKIDDNGNNTSHGSVFSKLKFIYICSCHRLESLLPSLSAQDLLALEIITIRNCDGLKYVFGQSQHVELVSLSQLVLFKLPNFVGIFEECYHLMSSCVKGSSSTSNYDSKAQTQLDPIKCNIFCWTNICCQTTIPLVDVDGDQPHDYSVASELDGQQLGSGLQDILCCDLPMMTCLFVGPKNSFALKNLARISIVRCEILKIAFSISILRFLPQLRDLRIQECEELEHIIEDGDDLESKDNSNSLSSRTCFPKLEGLVVIKCNKLKFVLPFSVCKELPKLRFLMITETNELEEIFKSEDDQKVDIPNLNILAFDMLPSLCYAQENQFQAVKNRFVRQCQKLPLTSALTATTFKEIDDLRRTNDYTIYRNVKSLFEQLPSAEAAEDFELPSVENVPDLTILPTNSKLEGSTSEKTPVATVTFISGTKNKPPIQVVASKQKGIEIEGTSMTNNDQVSLNDDASMKENSNADEQISKDDEIIVSKFKPSPSITSPIASMFPSMPSKGDPSQILPTNLELEGSTSEKTAVAIMSTISGTKNEPPIQVIPPSITFPTASQFPSMPSKGDPSQKVEDLSSYLLVKRELEQLVSKNHLDCENLSLLTDFLVENPSVRLKDTSLRYRYKGCAYSLLAELLKFLETHSLLEVSGSCHSEFVELLQDARNFAFDKEWLDGVERRALFPEIQISPDALEKILDSKKRVAKDVEDLRLKIDILSQVAEDLKHQLTSSEAVLETIVQQEAVLSAPIGY